MKRRFSRSYFTQIWILFVAAIGISVTILSVALTRTFEVANTRTVNSLNQEVLEETRRVNEYVRRMIRVSGMELFFEPSVQSLMNQVELSNFEVLTALRRVDSVMSMGTHIHSIYVYNPRRRFIYASSNLRSGYIDGFYDKGVDDLLFGTREPMRLVPVPRLFSRQSRHEPIYSFVYYDPMSFQGPVDGALIINVTLDWLAEVLGSEADSDSQQFFVDKAGRIVYHPDRSRFLTDLSHKTYMRRILQASETSGYFVSGRGSQRTLIMYTVSDDGDLYLIRQVAYSRFMRPLWVLRGRVLALLALFLVLGTGVAFIMSRRIYRPIGELVTALPPQENQDAEKEDDDQLNDIEYISSRIETMITHATDLETASAAYRATLRSELLKELLHGDLQGLSDDDLRQLFLQYDLEIDLDGAYSILLIDGDKDTRSIRELAWLALHDAEPMIRLDMGSHCVVLSSSSTQASLVKTHTAGMVIIEGPQVVGIKGLAQAYTDMLDERNKVLLYGYTGVFSTAEYQRSSLVFRYPADHERAILHSIRSGDESDCMEQLRLFLRFLSEYRYDQVRFSLKRLYVSMQFQVQELQSQGSFAASFEFCIHEFDSKLRDIRGVRALEQLFGTMFAEVQQEIRRQKNERALRVVAEVEHIIARDFADPNFSLVRIAEDVGLTASYLTKIFKEVRAYSVSEAILNFRIDQAKRLLHQEPSTPAREVAARVGFANENYFYTLFRKHTGYTPSTYRKQFVMSSTLQNS